jgi:putative aminopeptidase FrvX
MPTFDQWFETIAELVMCHSPSGAEQEIDQWLQAKFQALGIAFEFDEAGNGIAKIPGQPSPQQPQRAIAITAHKDEIGLIVKAIEPDGKLQVRKLGGAFPWVYGEGVVDLLGDRQTLSGILSFGSRHVSHESAQKAQQEDHPVRWEDAWVETKCTPQELAAAGIHPGTKGVVGKHRKRPFRLKDHIASYTLDNKASIAILIALAETLKNPIVDVYLIASAKEEIGAIGAMYFTQRRHLEALIALEICPVSTEYPIEMGEVPVLLTQDAYGLYDDGLNQEIWQAAQGRVELQWAAISGFGSDASIAMKFGHVARAACLGFPTQNTHGYEIAHLGAIAQCVEVLRSYIAGLA